MFWKWILPSGTDDWKKGKCFSWLCDIFQEKNLLKWTKHLRKGCISSFLQSVPLRLTSSYGEKLNLIINFISLTFLQGASRIIFDYLSNQRMNQLQQNQGNARPPSLNIIVVNESEKSEPPSPFSKLRKYSANLLNQEPFEDDQFKLEDQKMPKGVIKKRLKDIFPKDAQLIDNLSDSSESQVCRGELYRPSYLCEMQMLPQWHFMSLIQPRTINEQGYYHVAVVQNGRIAKLVIDDFVYYDEARQQIVSHPFLEEKPWIHIILKAWAKLNRGYDRLDTCPPFAFIKAFSFPDWGIFNPGLEDLENIILRLGPSNKKEHFYVCRTKSDPMVGRYGLIPNCAAYLITGYYQEYASIFLKLRSFAGDKWNGCSQEKSLEKITEHIPLSRTEFIIPLQTFVNIFHLIYYTTNKYSRRQLLHYNKYTISLDARESKATFIRFELLGEGLAQQSTSLNFYFPSVKISDYGNPKSARQNESLPPMVKICIGRCLEQINMQGSVSYAESLRENILKNEEGYFLNPSNSKYEHIASDYFTGYSNEVTYHLKLRPGKYLIRLKVEKLLPEYRALLNVTSNEDFSIGQCKLSKREQTTFLSEVLSNKARREERNVIHPFPHKKQTWIMANPDFDLIGYGTLTFQTGKNDLIVMIVTIDSKKLKQEGYRIKNKVELSELSNEIRLKEGESVILILKRDEQFKGQQNWPPEGISISYQNSIPKAKQKKPS